ncbi:MAG: hypothetical protein J0H74_14780 [Chitinophagaceae bacterium]|nr:hypothetical protein [Chitinophagaceae bacterium]
MRNIICLVCLTFVKLCSAQVQVSEEPMHHKVFDNGWVRMLDVHIPPGDTSLWHKHSTPSVFLILSNTKTGSEAKIEPHRPPFTDGRIWFEGFYDTVRIHRVWNADDHEFHVIDMELPHRPNKTIDPPIADSAFTLLFDEKPVRGYRMTLGAGGSDRLSPRKAPVVIICVDDGTVVKVEGAQLHKKGDYIFIPAGAKLDFQNEGQADAKMAVFELK